MTEANQTPPADEGPVERPVRPPLQGGLTNAELTHKIPPLCVCLRF